MPASSTQKFLLLVGRIFWIAYLFLCGIAIGLFAPGAEEIRLSVGLGWTVPWIMATVVLGYTAIASAIGVNEARGFAWKLLLGGIVVQAIAGMTGLFGRQLLYTTNAGWLLVGLLPVFLPFLWLVIAGSSAVVAGRIWPGGPRWGRALVASAVFGVLLLLLALPAERYLIWWVPGFDESPVRLPVFAGVPLFILLVYAQMFFLPPPARFDLRGRAWRAPAVIVVTWLVILLTANLSLLLAEGPN